MSQEKGNLIDCMSKSLHHLADNTLRLMQAVASREDYDYRMRLLRAETKTALAQVKKIEKIAIDQGNTEILKIINEALHFGHDF